LHLDANLANDIINNEVEVPGNVPAGTTLGRDSTE
jgi:hypothetical protein